MRALEHCLVSRGSADPAIFMLLFTISVLVLNLPLVRQDFDPGHRKTHDSLVKATLKNAATAQETYFVDNRTYTNKVSSLNWTDPCSWTV